MCFSSSLLGVQGKLTFVFHNEVMFLAAEIHIDSLSIKTLRYQGSKNKGFVNERVEALVQFCPQNMTQALSKCL